MWKNIKGYTDRIFKVILALSLIGFMFLVFITIANKDMNQNTQLVTIISLIAVALSLPGNIDTIASEINPKKKVYKLSCKCPKCKSLIEMDMKEE